MTELERKIESVMNTLPESLVDKYEALYYSQTVVVRTYHFLWWRLSYLYAFFFGGPCQAERFLLRGFQLQAERGLTPKVYCLVTLPEGEEPPPGLYLQPPKRNQKGQWCIMANDPATLDRLSDYPLRERHPQ